MGKLTLLLGGARSGKSTLAEKLATQRGERVLYIATAQAFDDEMKLRIEKHQKQRPASWKTIESSTGIAAACRGEMQSVDVVLLDCVTLLANNIFMEISGDPEHLDEVQFSKVLQNEIDALLTVIAASTAEWIVVSNEVGLGLVPPYPLGRVYRDLLGRTNRQLAARADEVYLLVAGMAVPLHQVALKFDA